MISLFHIVTGRDLVPTCTTDTNSQFEFGMLHLQRSRSHQDMMRRNDCIRCERRVPCHGLLRRKQRRTRAVASAIPVNRSSRISHRSAGLEYCGGSGIPPRRNNRHAVDFSDDDFHDAWYMLRSLLQSWSTYLKWQKVELCIGDTLKSRLRCLSFLEPGTCMIDGTFGETSGTEKLKVSYS